MSEAGQGAVLDLAIIGGGINGCGIARDAAGRGLSVFLCEQDDLASGTSSAFVTETMRPPLPETTSSSRTYSFSFSRKLRQDELKEAPPCGPSSSSRIQ